MTDGDATDGSIIPDEDEDEESTFSSFEEDKRVRL